MPAIRNALPTISVFVLQAILATTAAAQQPVDLLKGPISSAQRSQHGFSAIEAEYDPSGAEQGVQKIRIELPDSYAVILQRDGYEQRGPGSTAWRGREEGNADSRAVLTVHKDLVYGLVMIGDANYEIRPHSGRKLIVERLDTRSFPACEVGPEQYIGGGGKNGNAVTKPWGDTTTPPRGVGINTIDVMALYTAAARIDAGGNYQMEAKVQSAVDVSNTVFIDSDMTARFRLVHSEETTYTEGASSGDDLTWVRTNAAVGALRDTHAADMVSLIVDRSGFCGVGYVQRTIGSGFSAWPFQVTDTDCAVGNFTYTHEHGHNMGFEHNPENSSTHPSSPDYDPLDPSIPSNPWSYAHYIDDVYRTVMSYSNPCTLGCSRVTHFSNPDISTLGYPTGIADLRDNARTGDESAPVVELFRSTITPPGTDTVLAVRVSQGSDDAEQATISGSMLLTSSDLELGYDGATQQTVGLRFQSLPIPPGSTITSAHIEFERDETETGVAALTIHGQAADNPATFSSTGFNITNRSTTSSSVAWNPPEWDSGSERHFTPDLTTIVQELADRGGWASGNSMVFLIAGSGQRTAEAFEGEPQNAPMLHVTFNDGSTPISNSFVNVRITNGNDDVEELVSNGDMLMNSSDLEMVDDSGSHGGDQIVGLRFPGLAIPWGSTIVSSHIEFESDETNSENTSLTIHAEDIDDAPVFSSSDYDVSGRSPTTSSASWNPAEWSTANQKYLTSDLAEVVQEVVDRSGWQADNDMAFMISGSGKRVAESYDGDSPNAALLHVEFRNCDESQDLPGGVWVLFSLPCTPKNNTVAAIFNGLDTDDYLIEWAVIEFDAVSGSYAYRYPGDTLAGKRGYWFIKTGADYTLNLDGMENRDGLIALQSDAVNGRNNLAGHIPRVSLPWADVTVMDGASELTLDQADPDLGGSTGLACDQDPVPASCIMSRKMHLWNGTAYQAYDGSTPLMEGTLSVFDGFWVKAFKSGIELNVPAAPAPGRATEGGGDQAFFDAYRHGGEWAVRLVAEYEVLIDPGNVFGQLAGAKNGQDSHDMEELTPFGEPWLTIVFANKGWESVPWGYTSDFRAVTRSLQGSWRFTVKASEGVPGAWLRWDGPAEIIHSARLVDERSGKKYDIEPGGSLWVSFGRSEAWFRFEL